MYTHLYGVSRYLCRFFCKSLSGEWPPLFFQHLRFFIIIVAGPLYNNFFGTILAVYFAKKKKEYLIDILFKYAPKFGIKLDEKKNLTKEAISKYWMRVCLYFILNYGRLSTQYHVLL